jgi:hypothetical protein
MSCQEKVTLIVKMKPAVLSQSYPELLTILARVGK